MGHKWGKRIKKEHFTCNDVAKRVGGSQATVAMICEKFGLKHFRNGSWHIRFTRKQVVKVCAVVRLSQIFRPEYVVQKELYKKLSEVGKAVALIDPESGKIIQEKIDVDSI